MRRLLVFEFSFSLKENSRDFIYIKMRVTDYIKDSIKWLWQLPQNILALCIEGILCQTAYRCGIVDGNIIILSNILPSCISLGDYIFINGPISEESMRHKCGHSKQSDILGPLYLIVIVIPSLLHNIAYYLCSKVGIKWNYFKFYAETWANRLAGLNPKRI